MLKDEMIKLIPFFKYEFLVGKSAHLISDLILFIFGFSGNSLLELIS